MRRLPFSSTVVVPLVWSLVASYPVHADSAPTTSTPIKHLVVIFDENNAFDHYFGTYPLAQNNAGETPFHAAADTPAINGLTPTLLSTNPNQANAGNPVRLSHPKPLPATTSTSTHPSKRLSTTGYWTNSTSPA
jgi:phospholipase C